MVFAILLMKGMELTPNTLFALSQVTLVQAVKLLESWGVDVEVVGIKAGSPDDYEIQHLAA